MARIGLIDVDGHNFPNLALMRISSYHKARGDTVEWWWTDMIHYDVVYMSKIFSDAYSKDIPEPLNADVVIKGGTGYCISLCDGVEVYDKQKNKLLPHDIECQRPDYSLYPQYAYAVAMTTRGCPRGCPFCHVQAKEGNRSVKVSDVGDFWNGQKEIKVLDQNITACADKHDLFQQYAKTGAWIDFTQGLDIRCLTERDIDDLNAMKIKTVHFAWDNPSEDLSVNFSKLNERFKIKDRRRRVVYVLTNYNSTIEEDLFRIYKLRELGFWADVRIYDKPHAPQQIRDLQRWCNNRVIFESCNRFEDYKPRK